MELSLDSQPLLLNDIKYSFSHFTPFIDPNDPSLDQAHIHNYYEIYVNLSGDASFWVKDRLIPIKRGDAILTRPSELHFCMFHKPCIHEHYRMWISAPEDCPLLAFMHRANFDPYYSSTEENKQQLLALFANLQHAEETAGRLEQTIALLQLFQWFNERPTAMQSRAASQSNPELQTIMNFINQNFCDIVHIQELYDRFFISASTLNRWFLRYVGMTPKKFLEAKKLEFACHLLEEGCSVTEICVRCNFTDSSHFIAVFRKKFGKTPGQYRHTKKDATLR